MTDGPRSGTIVMMLDRNLLGSWVNARHLEATALAQYHRAFSSPPTRVVVLRSFLREPVADALTRFLTSEARFEPRFSLYSETDVPEKTWLDAAESERLYRVKAFAGLRSADQLSENLVTYLRFHNAIHGDHFRAFFETVVGRPLGRVSSYMHGMTAGDFLAIHDDAVLNRRLAFVLYLTRGWLPEFGGELHIVPPGGPEAAVATEYNSLVMFDVTSKNEHFVARVTPAARELMRVTIGGFVQDPAVSGVDVSEMSGSFTP